MTDEEKQKFVESGKNTRFKSGVQAVESGRRGGIQNGINQQKKKILREAILKELNAQDLEEIARGLINRSKKEVGDYIALRDTIDGKPTQEINADIVGGLSTSDRTAILDEAAAELRRQWSGPVDDTGTSKE